MKIFNVTGYVKPILMIIAGIILAFIPGFISGIFYIIGGTIIILNIITLLSGVLSVAAAPIAVPKAVIGIIIGLLITAIPNLVSFSLPVVVGILLCISGISRIVRALRRNVSGSKKTFNIIVGAVVAVSGLLLFLNPFSSTGIFLKVVGIILIIAGIVSLANNADSNNGNHKSSGGASDVVDVDYSVKDDDMFRRLK